MAWHLEWDLLYFAEDEHGILIIEVAGFILKNSIKMTSFHIHKMYMMADKMFKELRAVHEDYCSENFFSFSAYMKSKLIRTPDIRK